MQAVNATVEGLARDLEEVRHTVRFVWISVYM
jgi:hypothetical protein